MAVGRLRLLSPASPWLLSDSFANVDKIAARLGPAVIALHPADAAERGLAEGDDALVANDSGSLPHGMWRQTRRFLFRATCGIPWVPHDSRGCELHDDPRTSGGVAMTFGEILAQVLDLLRRERRLSYRALKVRFRLDDNHLEALKDEIIEAKQLAVDEKGRVLVWTGDAVAAAPPAAALARVPVATIPTHLA